MRPSSGIFSNNMETVNLKQNRKMSYKDGFVDDDICETVIN